MKQLEEIGDKDKSSSFNKLGASNNTTSQPGIFGAGGTGSFGQTSPAAGLGGSNLFGAPQQKPAGAFGFGANTTTGGGLGTGGGTGLFGNNSTTTSGTGTGLFGQPSGTNQPFGA